MGTPRGGERGWDVLWAGGCCFSFKCGGLVFQHLGAAGSVPNECDGAAVGLGRTR
jgi:hypothetical protein